MHIKHFPLLLIISLVLTSCLSSVYNPENILDHLEQGATDEIKKLTAKLHESNEKIIYAARVHFYLSRWENFLGDGGREKTFNRCTNDIMLITEDKIYISENYMDISYGPSLCYGSAGNAALRPNKLYIYDINQIENIEWFIWPDYWGQEKHLGPSTFSVNFRIKDGKRDRF